jgi:HK97 family phage portal protein
VRFPRLRDLPAKAFELYRGLFDYGASSVQNGFYPVQIGGMAVPPVNLVDTATGRPMTPKLALELAAVWACVWLIADTVASLPMKFIKRQGTNTWGNVFESQTATVCAVQPNQYMNAFEFWLFMTASKLLWGNAYAAIDRGSNGEVISFDPLLPQFMIPYKKSNTGEMRYKYVPQGLMSIPMVDYSWDQIFHWKWHSLDGIVGLSPIEYGRQTLGIAKSAEMGTSDTFRNGMKSQGFLTYDRVMKPDQRQQVKESLRRYRTGGDDAGGFMVLEAGVNFSSLTLNPQDVQLLQTRQFEIEDICRFYNVPPVLIGHNNTTAWGTGIEQLALGFQSLTLRPHIRSLEMAIARTIVPVSQRGSVVATVQMGDLMAADSAARSALYSAFGQNGIMTRNEMRAREHLPPMDGGDTLTVQSNLVPLDQLEELGGQPTPHMPPPAQYPGQPGSMPWQKPSPSAPPFGQPSSGNPPPPVH